ncbi:MAG: MOSC N-terminal beta barrel domain-containing protein [Steroidobacteraceae bacterium]|jgi:uncharacterized protein YcbX
MTQPILKSLHVYPLKSGQGFERERETATRWGLSGDRRFMLTTPEGRFITQREQPHLALLVPHIEREQLTLVAPERAPLQLDLRAPGSPITVQIWKDTCQAQDLGSRAADWVSEYLGTPCRLVRFDDAHGRLSNPEWCHGIEAPTRFTDGFPFLVLGTASLADLNQRLAVPLPMNRFRPSLVIEGWEPYDEDRVDELQIGAVRLKLVKACTRCRITATDQLTGVFQGDEPLRTLKSYRMDHALHGVIFGQNAILVDGDGAQLHCGEAVKVRWKSDP